MVFMKCILCLVLVIFKLSLVVIMLELFVLVWYSIVILGLSVLVMLVDGGEKKFIVGKYRWGWGLLIVVEFMELGGVVWFESGLFV